MSTGNRLYFKLSAIFLLIITVLGAMYVLISHYINADYVAETNQKLYGGIAEHTVHEVQPLVGGVVDTNKIKDIMHSMMVINPSVEVYLLNPEGGIITYVAPNKTVQLKSIDLEPVKTFIAADVDDRPFIKGNDPRHPERENIFSAAEIRNDDNKLEGYVYIILASEEQNAVISYLQGSYMYRLGKNMFFLSMLAAALVGLLAIWYLTRNLRRITETVQRFSQGDMSARIPDCDKGDFVVLADTYNSMADQITANIEEMKSLENLRQELIANVSHDLRTPLAIMQGFVETLLMKNEQLSAAEREQHLQTVLQGSERLSSLISQLFEYSKLEAHQVVPQKEAFHLGELAQDIAHKFSVLAEEKGIEISVALPQNLPLIFADIGLVERVLQNLLDNALKFTPQGGQVSLLMSASDTGVEVRVADTGPGIPEAEQAHIFDRYKKASRSVDGRNLGAGLGLAIVKKILELHDQTIRVQSKVKEGTAFIFDLPAYA
ncbi:MAG: HAMP domain-containing sensor histidine kinase [Bacteroidota bacterium]